MTVSHSARTRQKYHRWEGLGVPADMVKMCTGRRVQWLRIGQPPSRTSRRSRLRHTARRSTLAPRDDPPPRTHHCSDVRRIGVGQLGKVAHHRLLRPLLPPHVPGRHHLQHLACSTTGEATARGHGEGQRLCQRVVRACPARASRPDGAPVAGQVERAACCAVCCCAGPLIPACPSSGGADLAPGRCSARRPPVGRGAAGRRQTPSHGALLHRE